MAERRHANNPPAHGVPRERSPVTGCVASQGRQDLGARRPPIWMRRHVRRTGPDQGARWSCVNASMTGRRGRASIRIALFTDAIGSIIARHASGRRGKTQSNQWLVWLRVLPGMTAQGASGLDPGFRGFSKTTVALSGSPNVLERVGGDYTVSFVVGFVVPRMLLI